MSITHISKSETLKNNRLETGHIFLLISLLDKKCIHLAIFYYPCSMYLSPIPLLIQSMPFFITLPWYHMPIVWMPHCNMLIVWLPLTSMPIFHTAILLYDKKQYAIPAIATEQESPCMVVSVKTAEELPVGIIIFEFRTCVHFEKSILQKISLCEYYLGLTNYNIVKA